MRKVSFKKDQKNQGFGAMKVAGLAKQEINQNKNSKFIQNKPEDDIELPTGYRKTKING